MTWVEKVKKLMKEKGINQKQLSLMSGITESSISRYFNDSTKIPRTDIIMNIAKALDVSVEYLMDDKIPKSSYTEIATVIARNGKNLTPEEKNKLIALIIGEGK